MKTLEDYIRKPRSKFLRVKCSQCGNEQVIFGSASTVVRCNVCETTLAEPRGGNAKIKARIVAVLE